MPIPTITDLAAEFGIDLAETDGPPHKFREELWARLIPFRPLPGDTSSAQRRYDIDAEDVASSHEILRLWLDVASDYMVVLQRAEGDTDQHRFGLAVCDHLIQLFAARGLDAHAPHWQDYIGRM